MTDNPGNHNPGSHNISNIDGTELTEATKHCGACGQTKPRTEFNKKGKRLQSKCRPCSQAHSRKYYADNRETLMTKLTERRKKQQAERQEQVVAARCQMVCSRCGNSGNLLTVNVAVSRLVEEQRPADEIAAALERAEWVCRSCHGKQAGASRAGQSHIPGVKTVNNLILDAARDEEKGLKELYQAVAAERDTTFESVRQQTSKLTKSSKLVRTARGKYRTA